MASKAKTLQVKDKEKDDKAADAPRRILRTRRRRCSTCSDAAVKKMIKQGRSAAS